MANCIICTDKDKFIKELTEERDNYKELYLESHNLSVQKDYVVQNQKQVILNTKNTLGLLTAENKYLWGLVGLRAAENNA